MADDPARGVAGDAPMDGSASREGLDAVARTAAQLLSAPIALVLVGDAAEVQGAAGLSDNPDGEAAGVPRALHAAVLSGGQPGWDGDAVAVPIRGRAAPAEILGSLVVRATGRRWSGADTVALADVALAAASELALRAATRDLAERRLAEEQARRSAAVRIQAERMAHLGFWQWEIRRNRVTWSDELYRIYGLSSAELVPSFEGYLARVHPDDRARVTATIQEALRRAGPFELEERIVRPDGQVRYLHSWGTVTVDDSGAPIEMIGTCLDLSERRRAEEEQRHAAEQLRQAQKMEAIGRLAAGVAHDFNNLLTIIGGSAQLLSLHGLSGREARESIAHIDGAGRRAAQLTKQLLALSRQQVLERAILDLGDIVREMSALLLRLLPPAIELRTEIAPDLGPIRGDRSQLEQVILNLAVNARDAMPAGGILRLSARNDGDQVLLSVADDGTGMAPEVQARIFEPFFTTKAEGAGTGLGLAMVYGIVAQSGGRIEVASTPGAGTTFLVLLPRADERAEARPPPTRHTTSPGTETILLVEDDDAVRAIVRALLEEHAYQVVDVRDPEQAIAAVDAPGSAIDLLFTDVHLPRMSGVELARRLQQRRPALKVLFMSGRREMAGEAEAPGPMIEKPFGVDLLATKLRQVLDAGERAAAG